MEVTVNEGIIGTYQGEETSLKMRVYNRRTFTTVENRVVIGSELGSTEFYKEVNCSVADNEVTHESFTLDSTEDALSDPKDTYYTFGLYTNAGTFLTVIATKIKVPDTSPTTIASLQAYNLTVDELNTANASFDEFLQMLTANPAFISYLLHSQEFLDVLAVGAGIESAILSGGEFTYE